MYIFLDSIYLLIESGRSILNWKITISCASLALSRIWFANQSSTNVWWWNDFTSSLNCQFERRRVWNPFREKNRFFSTETERWKNSNNCRDEIARWLFLFSMYSCCIFNQEVAIEYRWIIRAFQCRPFNWMLTYQHVYYGAWSAIMRWPTFDVCLVSFWATIWQCLH